MKKFIPTEQQIETLYKKLWNNEPLTDEDKAVNAIINGAIEQDAKEFAAIGQQPEYKKMVQERLEAKDNAEVEAWIKAEREIAETNPHGYTNAKERELAEKNIRELSAFMTQDGAKLDTINRQLRKWKNYLQRLVKLEDELRTATEGANLPYTGVSPQGRAVIPQNTQTSQNGVNFPKGWEDLHNERANAMWEALIDGGLLVRVQGDGLQEYTKAEGVSTNDLYILCHKIQDYLALGTSTGKRDWANLERILGIKNACAGYRKIEGRTTNSEKLRVLFTELSKNSARKYQQ